MSYDPGYPIAAVSRGKQVIVGSRESLHVGDHDFSNYLWSLMRFFFKTFHPRRWLMKVTRSWEVQMKKVGIAVYYAVKSMISSTAWRCVVELGNVLEKQYTIVFSRVYCYTDGGGDLHMTFLQVQSLRFSDTRIWTHFRSQLNIWSTTLELNNSTTNTEIKKLKDNVKNLVTRSHADNVFNNKADEINKLPARVNKLEKPIQDNFNDEIYRQIDCAMEKVNNLEGYVTNIENLLFCDLSKVLTKLCSNGNFKTINTPK